MCWNTVQVWSHEGRILSTCEKTRQKSYDLSFFKITVLSLDYVFMPLSGMVDRSEFTSDYLLQMAIFVYMPLWKNMVCFCHAQLVLVIVHFNQMTLFNS